MMVPRSTNVLLVEDNPGDADLVRLALVEAPGQVFEVTWVEGLAEARAALASGSADVVLLDLGLPDSQGRQTLEAVQAADRSRPIVVLTGLDDEALALEAVRRGAQDYLGKQGLEGALLVRSLRHAIERKRAEEEIRLLNRVLKTSSEINQMIVRERDPERLLNETCRILVEHGGLRLACSALVGDEGGGLRWQAGSGEATRCHSCLEGLNPDGLLPPLARAVAEGRALVVEEEPPTGPESPSWCEHAKALELPVCAAVPLRVEGEVVGAFGVFDAEAATFEQPEVVRLFDELASDIGFALEKIRNDERRRSAEEALRQAQKMEAIGKLAGGVAHDFNNLLQVGLGLVDLLRLGGLDSEALAEELDAVFHRGAALTRRLLIFARKEETDLRSDELNEVVQGTSKMLDRLLKENIRFRLDLAEGRLPVRADRGQLEQVMVNLTVNAADAMPNGGELTVRTQREGDRVCLAVEDTGGGIPEGIRDRIFEPFFTTKASGGGSGIGLSVVHGIVAEHGGSVEVRDRDGGGTVVRVLLPEEAARGAAPEAVPARAPEQALRGKGERVLVVEDQESVRRLLCTMLGRLGYRVTDVASAEDALALDGPFDALVSDVVLAGATGPELARAAAGRWPGLRIVLISGYAEEQVLEQAAGPVHFLPKPFDLATLSAILRRALA